MWTAHLPGSDFPADMIDQSSFTYTNPDYSYRWLWKSSYTNKWYISNQSDGIGPKLRVTVNPGAWTYNLTYQGIINDKAVWHGTYTVYYSATAGQWILCYFCDAIDEFTAPPGVPYSYTHASGTVPNPLYPTFEPPTYTHVYASLDQNSKMRMYGSPTIEGSWTLLTGDPSTPLTITTVFVFPANWSDTFCGNYQSLAAGYTVGWRKLTGGPDGRTFQEISNYHNGERTLLSNDELYNIWWDSTVSKHVCSTKCGEKDLNLGYWEGGASWAGLYTYFVTPPGPVLPDFTLVFDSYVDNTAFPRYTQQNALMTDLPTPMASTELKSYWAANVKPALEFQARYDSNALTNWIQLRVLNDAMNSSSVRRFGLVLRPSDTTYGWLSGLFRAVASMFHALAPGGSAAIRREDVPDTDNSLFLSKAIKNSLAAPDKLWPIGARGWMIGGDDYSSWPKLISDAVAENVIRRKIVSGTVAASGHPWNLKEKLMIYPVKQLARAGVGVDWFGSWWGFPSDFIVISDNGAAPSRYQAPGTCTGCFWDKAILQTWYDYTKALIVNCLDNNDSSSFRMDCPGIISVSGMLDQCSLAKTRNLFIVKNYYPFAFLAHVYMTQKRRYKYDYDPARVPDYIYAYDTTDNYNPPVLVQSIAVPAYGSVLLGDGIFPDAEPELPPVPLPPVGGAPFYNEMRIYEEWSLLFYIERTV